MISTEDLENVQAMHRQYFDASITIGIPISSEGDEKTTSIEIYNGLDRPAMERMIALLGHQVRKLERVLDEWDETGGNPFPGDEWKK